MRQPNGRAHHIGAVRPASGRRPLGLLAEALRGCDP